MFFLWGGEVLVFFFFFFLVFSIANVQGFPRFQKAAAKNALAVPQRTEAENGCGTGCGFTP